jgi:ketosteroid isomerase-like protein
MSSRQVEIIHRSYEAFRDDDEEALLSLYHPDAVWDMSSWKDFPDADVYRGLAGIGEVLRILREVFGELNVRPAEIIEVSDGRFFVEGGMTIRGKTSGVEIDVPPFGQIIDFRDDLIALVENYTDVEEARGAAGLVSPQGP